MDALSELQRLVLTVHPPIIKNCNGKPGFFGRVLITYPGAKPGFKSSIIVSTGILTGKKFRHRVLSLVKPYVPHKTTQRVGVKRALIDMHIAVAALEWQSKATLTPGVVFQKLSALQKRTQALQVKIALAKREELRHVLMRDILTTLGSSNGWLTEEVIVEIYKEAVCKSIVDV